MPFNYPNVIHPTGLSHQFAHPRPNRPTQHRPAVFGDPNQVVLEIVLRVTGRPIGLHMDCFTSRLRLKARDFLPFPEGDIKLDWPCP
jgi:hypothetical protein